mmetsp:Transcript_1663/g.1884  ORF Transcript_1663/g.1884 Transcript_1663/m.1884 type:complete len:84 (-) Transcript_1663:39-290(-)
MLHGEVRRCRAHVNYSGWSLAGRLCNRWRRLPAPLLPSWRDGTQANGAALRSYKVELWAAKGVLGLLRLCEGRRSSTEHLVNG